MFDVSMKSLKKVSNVNQFQSTISPDSDHKHCIVYRSIGCLHSSLKKTKIDNLGHQKLTLPSIKKRKISTHEGKKIKILKARKMSRYSVVKNLVDRGTISKHYAKRKSVSINKFANKS